MSWCVASRRCSSASRASGCGDVSNMRIAASIDVEKLWKKKQRKHLMKPKLLSRKVQACKQLHHSPQLLRMARPNRHRRIRLPLQLLSRAEQTKQRLNNLWD